MSPMDASWMQELLEMFRVEGIEHLKAIAEGLVKLEQTPGNPEVETLETIYREAHSLKGAARSIGLVEVETVCQSLEDVLSAFKHGQTTPRVRDLDCLHLTLDALGEHIRHNTPLDVKALLTRLGSLCDEKVKVEPISAAPAVENKPAVTRESLHEAKIEVLRLPVSRMDRLMLSAEELVGPKLAVDHLASDLRLLLQNITQWREEFLSHRPGNRQDLSTTEASSSRFWPS